MVLPGSPVRQIPTDPPGAPPEPGIALCLSGGGFRATLFHLGALWRLNQLGYLPRLERISSVSGGSITAAALGMNWAKLEFDSSGIGTAFEAAVVRPIRSLTRRTIDVWAVLAGFGSGGTLGSRAAGIYARHLLGRTTLQDLPDRPTFVFNATSLQSGVLWRFSKSYAWDYRVGQIPRPAIALATAVAASSAFPPFLSPVLLRFRDQDYKPGSGLDLQRPPYTTRPVLTDGGVYDNLGLETAWKRYTTILVSDGGAVTHEQQRPAFSWFLQVPRVLFLIDAQVGSLRKSQAIDGFIQGQRQGTYWGIAGHIEDYALPDALPCAATDTARLAAVPTRLKALDAGLQERLINWGYAVCDAAVRKHVQAATPPAGFPYPASWP